jgi:hypothetical protein
MMEALVIVGTIVALNVLALWYGADSRDGNDWRNIR